MKIIIGTMFTHIDFSGNTLLREKIQDMAHHALGIKEEGAFYSRAYKSGFWDGITDFYDMKEDKFHTGLLDQFLEGLRLLMEKDNSFTYELVDERPAPPVHHDAIDEKIVLGNGDEDPITLRDYQYESVKSVFEQQVGIVNVATNGGKTEIASGVIQQILPYIKRGERIAFFTHSREIFGQSAERIAKRVGLKVRDVGFVGDGKFDIKNKKIVFVMVPTLVSALKDPKKGIKFTPNETVIKLIAEEITPKFRNTVNTRKLIQNYLKNRTWKTKAELSAEEQLMYVAYDKKFTDKSAQMHLNKYVVEFNKIMEKKNKKKFQKYNETKEFLDSIKVMIADEVHHSKADTWYTSLSMCENAIYRVGLTGTVDKKDKMGWQRLQAIFSQVTVRVSNEYLIDKGVSSKPTIRLVPVQEPRNLELASNFMEAYKAGIVENEYRNKLIADLVESYRKRRPGGVLVSVKEIAHGDTILELLRARGLEAEFINGGSDADHRATQLERFSKSELPILIASTIVDEGVDMKSIGCMVLGAGGKSMRQQLQRIGRGLRLNGIDGNSVMVFDFWDQTNTYLLNHSKERLKIFREERFDVKVLGGK
ncbi:DNA helicase [Bacillus phage vB_BmeM-Goe8]|uniref:DNA helicase n=1 Tax=Bacillus phage vB_BmeM-Goe8 TaxID=2593638 RepID=A0A516KMR1_9CAUD|nr:DNA helicase [Bacillus phage vB_BmeM-Goe8]QDP42879.1 DNA helicase [Bacillus phage vB_BmeM-Goe8]